MQSRRQRATFFHQEERKPTLPLGAEEIGLCIPCGIGDASWLLSKIGGLSSVTGRRVLISMPDPPPQRGHQLVELCPQVQWAGYEPGWRNRDVFQHTLPPSATLADFTPGKWHALEVNTWLEQGRALAEWLPEFPCDYHYEIKTPAKCAAEAKRLTNALPKPYVALYVSNRDKANYPGWALWRREEWRALVARAFPERSVVLVGAEYDRDFTQEVACALVDDGVPVRTCLGQPLGVALAVIKGANCFVSYPSGLGILGGVLGTRTLMLLPKVHPKLHGFADPEDVAAGRYRTLVAPTVAEAATWLAGQS